MRAAKEHVTAGDVFQVVLSQRFDLDDLGADPFDVYRVLRLVNPSPYLYFLRFPEVTVVGASPEPMVRLREGTVISRPIAGSRPRGATPEEDARLEGELVEDPKEVAEHVMLIDLARNDVGRVVTLRHRGGRRDDGGRALQPHHAPDLPGVGSPGPGQGARSTCCGPPSRPARCPGRPRCGPWRSSTTSSRPSAASTAGWSGYLDFSRQSRHRHRHPHHDGRPPTAGPRSRPGPASWPTATRPRRTPSAPTRRPPCCRRWPWPGPPRSAATGRRPTAPTRTTGGGLRGPATTGVGRPGGRAATCCRSPAPTPPRYLQGQCSQDLDALAVGGSRRGPAAQPAGQGRRLRAGHPDRRRRVRPRHRRRAAAPAPVARLERFRLRTKVDHRAARLGLPGGPRARAPPSAAVARRPGLVLPVDVARAGRGRPPRAAPPGDPELGDVAARPARSGAPRRPWEAARIEAGVPVGGREVTESTIAAEVGLVDRTVSFTKGCFTGQELVARLDARGSNVARRLCGSWWSADGTAAAAGRGRGVDRRRRPRGRAADLGGLVARSGATVALATLHRRVDAARGGRVDVRLATAVEAPAEAVALPLVVPRPDRPAAPVRDRATLPRRLAAPVRTGTTAEPRGEHMTTDAPDGTGGRRPAGRGDGRRAHHHLDPGPGRDARTSSSSGCGPPCRAGSAPEIVDADQSREQRHVVGDPAGRRPRGPRTAPTVERRLVARVEPPATDYPVFTTYDLDMQFRVMRLVARPHRRARSPRPTGTSRTRPSSAAPSSSWTGSTGWSPPTSCPTRSATTGSSTATDAGPAAPSRSRPSGHGRHPLDHPRPARPGFLELDQPGTTSLERSSQPLEGVPRAGWSRTRRSPAARRLLRLADRQPARPTPAATPCPGATAGSAT